MATKQTHDEDSFQLVDNDELDRNLQPHLEGMRNDPEDPVSLYYVNQTLDATDSKNDTGNAASENQEQTNNNTANDSVVTAPSDSDVTITSPPVYYSHRTGQSTVVEEPVVIRQPNGVHVIRTQRCCELAPHRHVQERPLRLKHIKMMKAFSVMAIVLFFPLGIPAMYYAFKCEQEFHAGIMRGDLDLARKLCKRTERLIIFSVMASLLVAVAVFAVVERIIMKDDDEYWKNRSRGVVMPTGR